MRWSALIVSLLALCCSACRGPDARLDDAHQSIQSVRATTTTVAQAWLSGDVSNQFAHAAIERAYQLSEQARTGLASSPALMADARAAAATQDCESLSRLLARLGDSIERGDREAAQAALDNGVGAHVSRTSRLQVTP